ncbi:MAG: hypothetical protein PHI93_02960 [Kiritimatiellae bacterium]|nr:hypothetical protein [Kiritimatiellia bacterium]
MKLCRLDIPKGFLQPDIQFPLLPFDHVQRLGKVLLAIFSQAAEGLRLIPEQHRQIHREAFRGIFFRKQRLRG